MHKFGIYEEGFMLSGMDSPVKAHFLAYSYGNDFLDACKNYINDGHDGQSYVDKSGNRYYGNWGCRWYPTLIEAQAFLG